MIAEIDGRCVVALTLGHRHRRSRCCPPRTDHGRTGVPRLTERWKNNRKIWASGRKCLPGSAHPPEFCHALSEPARRRRQAAKIRTFSGVVTVVTTAVLPATSPQRV